MNQPQSEALRAQILENPELILEDPELMTALLGADDDDGANGRNIVDLRSRLVQRLEERLEKLEETNRVVIAAAYENLASTNQVHRSLLALLDAPDFAGFLKVLGEDVMHTLAIDVVRLGIETADAPPGAPLGPKGPQATLVIALPDGGVGDYLGAAPGQPMRRVTLRRTTAQADDLYGCGPSWIQSEAVLRLDLGAGHHVALLGLGSEDPQRFSSDQGTDLLSFFAGAIERILRRWLG